MRVSKPSVCVAVNTLKDGGFLTMDEDHFLHLTDVGRRWPKRFMNVIASLRNSLLQQVLILKLQKSMPAG